MICIPYIVEDGVTATLWVNPKYIVSMRDCKTFYVLCIYSSVNTICEYRVTSKCAASIIDYMKGTLK